MTSTAAARPSRSPQRLLAVIAAVISLLVGLAGTASASTTTRPGSSSGLDNVGGLETRVGAARPNASLFVGSGRTVPAGHVGQTCPRFDGTTVGSCVATKPPATSDVLLNSSKQLQSKFKHAGDFGVTGNYSKANAAKFSAEINQHINSPGVTKIAGTYRGNPVTHYVDPATGLNVIADPSGVFVSGWKLSTAQLQNVLKHGGL